MLRLDMHRNVVRSGLDEPIQKVVRPRDHEMHVQPDVVRPMNRGNEVWTKGNIIHEVPVHDVQMQPVCTRPDCPRALLRQSAPIRRQDRGSNDSFLKVSHARNYAAPISQANQNQGMLGMSPMHHHFMCLVHVRPFEHLQLAHEDGFGHRMGAFLIPCLKRGNGIFQGNDADMRAIVETELQ